MIAAERKGQNAHQALAGIAASAAGEDVAVSVITSLLAVAALACLVPAWKASRVDPMQALQFE